MNTDIKFGTDGWRGKIAEDYTFDNVRRCAQGFADYLRSVSSPAQLSRGVVVGGDRRFNSEYFAVERDLMNIFPRAHWHRVNYDMITHGRAVCTAKRPACGACFLNDVCPTAFVPAGWRQSA